MTFLVYYYLGPLFGHFEKFRLASISTENRPKCVFLQTKKNKKKNGRTITLNPIRRFTLKMSCSRPPACSGVCRTVDPWCGTSDLCPAEWTGGQWLRWCRGQTTGQLRLRVRSVHTELPTTPPPPLATAPQH